MSFATWIAFIVAACIIAISPGSGAILSMSHGLSYGVKKTSATILGLQFGLLVVFFIAGAGIGSILLASDIAFNIIKTTGALYLMYLGVSQWRADIDIAPNSPTQFEHGVPVPAFRTRFLSGFLTNATNPKGIIFMVAVLPQFISNKLALLPQLLILAVTMCIIDLAVMHTYAYAAAKMQCYFRNPQSMKNQNRFFGGILITVGAALLFVKRASGN